MAMPRMFYIGDRPMVSSLELIIIATAAACSIGIHLFLTRTRAGVALRAMSSEYDLARVCGINTRSIASLVWVIATALAALAGILMGMRGTIYVDMGWQITLIILSAAVMGGLGSFYGVMAGALLIGIGMDMSVIFLNPAYRFAVAFVVIMLVLVFRPQGIFGGESRG
jgi:branched-subunit amino acid ABC-type transport system permease component